MNTTSWRVVTVVAAVACGSRLASADARPPVGAAAAVDRVVASVVVTPIWQSELDERGQTLDQAIDAEVVVRNANPDYVSVSPSDIDQAAAQYEKESHLDDARLDAALRDLHVSRASFRTSLSRQIITYKTLRFELGDKLGKSFDDFGAAATAWMADKRALVHVEMSPPITAAAGAVAWTALDGPTRTLEVTADDPGIASAARTALANEVGAALDRGRLRDELGHVFSLDGVGGVSVTAAQRRDGITLKVTIERAAILHGLVGQNDGTPFDLKDDKGALVGRPINPAMLDAAADELRDHFRELGFRRVTVGWHRVPAGAGQVDAQFEIVRGTSVVIDAIDIHGNVHAPRAALNAVLKGVVTAGTPWRDDQVTDAKLRLLIWYVDHGYVKADADVAEPTGAHSKLVFTITEGNQYRLGKIDIAGVPDTDRQRYLTLVGLHPGEVASRAAIMDAARRLRDAAHPSNLWTNTALDDAKHTFDVTFQLAGAGTTSDGEAR